MPRPEKQNFVAKATHGYYVIILTASNIRFFITGVPVRTQRKQVTDLLVTSTDQNLPAKVTVM